MSKLCMECKHHRAVCVDTGVVRHVPPANQVVSRCVRNQAHYVVNNSGEEVVIGAPTCTDERQGECTAAAIYWEPKQPEEPKKELKIELLQQRIELLQQKAEVMNGAVEILEDKCQQLRESHEQVAEHWHLVREYSLEQLREICKSIPPPEDLEGYKLEIRQAKCGDEYWLGRHWETCYADRMQHEYLVRVPIAEEPEYIEGDEITDELLKRGRVICEVFDPLVEEWLQTLLLMVDCSYNNEPSFVTKPVGCDNRVLWKQCRIKRSDIPQPEGKKWAIIRHDGTPLTVNGHTLKEGQVLRLTDGELVIEETAPNGDER